MPISANAQVKVRVTNSGCASYISNVIYITAIPTPTVSLAGTTTICNGNSAVLTATYTNTIAASVFEISADNGVTWTTVNGSSFTVSPVATTTYRVRVTNSPCATATSLGVTVTVNQPSVAGTVTLTTASTICSGGTVNTAVSGNLGTIQWQSSTDGTTWSNITGATFATNTMNPTVSSNTTIYYRVQVTNGVCTTVNSNAVQVLVKPDFTSVPTLSAIGSTTICSGSSISFTANWTPYIAGAVYEYSDDNGTTWNTLTATSNSTTFSLTFYNTAAAATTRQVLVRAANAPCNTFVSTPAITVTINPGPSAILSTNANNICVGSNANIT